MKDLLRNVCKEICKMILRTWRPSLLPVNFFHNKCSTIWQKKIQKNLADFSLDKEGVGKTAKWGAINFCSLPYSSFLNFAQKTF
jgi:hypothetical protein